MIINDYALTYFQNRVYSTPKVSFFSSSTDEELMEQRKIRFPGITPKRITDESIDVVIFNEERIVCVPPNSSQIVYGFNLQSEIYRDCNLQRFPKQKEITSSEFTKESSPYIFRNRLTYSFSESMEELKQIENEFWVTKFTNLPENQFVSSDYIKFCNDSSSNKMMTYPYSNQASYFIEYRLEPGRINH
ncbi:MAG: hypothetical protein C0596_03180 [Marinilabiliales bacterium]|nr:MAG: hypothetical protein C0596_03180 [Marinilabiliales bacterium]